VYLGWSAVNYTDSLEPGIVRGLHAQFLGRTRGDYTCEASLTGYHEEVRELLDQLGDGYLEAIFDISVTYQEGDGPTHTDEIRGCRLQSIANGHTQGTDGLAIDLTLAPTLIIRNGLHPLKIPLTGSLAPQG
jgi:hypothetical protein